jgi:hypothetical protein
MVAHGLSGIGESSLLDINDDHNRRDWKRISPACYICIQAKDPAFAYVLEKLRTGRWRVRCPDGDYMLHTRSGSVRTFKTAEVAVMQAMSDGCNARYGWTRPAPEKGVI